MKIEKIHPMTDKAIDALLPMMRADAAGMINDVNQHRAECYEFKGVGFCITRIEDNEDGNKELVIAATSANQGGDKALKIILDAAKKEGCASARVHSNRKGMGRFLAPLGFYQYEIIHKVDL